MNEKAFKKYLATGEYTRSTTQDEAPTGIQSALQKHDARFHPNGFKEGDSCKYREALANGDDVDKLQKAEREEQGANYKVTLDMVKPYLEDVEIDYDTRHNWGSPDAGWVRAAMKMIGFNDFNVECWEEGSDKKFEYDYEVDRFLMDDPFVNEDGIFETNDDGSTYYHQIKDYAKVNDKLDEIIRIGYVLKDKNLMLTPAAVNQVAKDAFENMLEHWRGGKTPPRYCVVPLNQEQWAHVSKMKAPEHFQSGPHRMYAHDPYVTEEYDNAVVWDVNVWQWEGNRHWEVLGKCVFVKEGDKGNRHFDYPMDYWD